MPLNSRKMTGQHKPQQEEESGEGAPLWIISFADMMSLLMAFFVMLATFSGFGPSEAERLQKAVKATLAPNYYGGWHKQHVRTAVGYQSPAAGQLERGSEKPTIEETQGKGLMKETQSGDFRTRKIFLIESRTVFWGTGTTLSPSGRDFLNTLASFAGRMPDRIVISEDGPADPRTEDEGQRAEDRGPRTEGVGQRPATPGDPFSILRPPASDLGLLRAARVLNYLTSKGVSKGRCSIAAKGMSPDRSFEAQRMLEIALLSADVYQ
jgi:outer membrane protein OmpA-like peptidoglycan-associated protein